MESHETGMTNEEWLEMKTPVRSECTIGAEVFAIGLEPFRRNECHVQPPPLTRDILVASIPLPLKRIKLARQWP